MKTQIFATKDPKITEREIKHMELVRALAEECAVLLENDGVLPLQTGSRIALYGSGARYTIKSGTGSGDVNTRGNITIEQGLEESGFTVTTKDWLARYDEKYKKAKQEYTDWLAEELAKGKESAVLLTFSHPFQAAVPEEIRISDMEDSDTDTAVYVISRNSGEGADRWNKEGDYLLYAEEKEQLKLLGRFYKKVALVLNIGGVMDLSEVKEIPGIGAVLLLSQLGNVTGRVLADILTGIVNPSGKLTDTWAKSYHDYPSSETFSHNDDNVDDEYYTEGIYVGYRYFDSFGIEPLYPFGYGRSYTDFQVETKHVTAEGEKIHIAVEVTNIGNRYAGKEVVQAYYSAPSDTLKKPYQELAAFAKTRLLAPGETEQIMLTFSIRDMASYEESSAAWVMEKGNYVIRVGNSSRNTENVAIIKLAETVKTEQLKNAFADREELREISPESTIDTAAETAPFVIEMDASKILTRTVNYNGGKEGYKAASYLGEREDYKTSKYPEEREGYKAANYSRKREEHKASKYPEEREEYKAVNYSGEREEYKAINYPTGRQEYWTEQGKLLTMQDVRNGTCRVEELVSQLSVEELAELCVGTLRTAEGSIVGNASSLVPGAAGDTSAVLWKSRGIRNLILADGPAGLRLQPVFKTTKEGTLLPGGEVTGDMYAPFQTSLKEEETDTYYQYCTAIPIGWALAQSWNMEMLEEIGDMVGKEMELFGVDLWLAPALNIHRNPLCGRNFEYYSEDPLISGKAAAAITRGVQRHKGRGTTIKHFAANSQEDNRYFTSSHVSERALREIYLKGFEIVVKEAQPLSIMTSYNLLNGIHTANSYELIQQAARDEWGFEGVVMTDWFTSQYQPALTGTKSVKYPISASAGCVYAGNDLQMPGCQENVDDLIKAVKSGEAVDGFRVSLADLQFCASNLLRVIAKAD